MRKKILAAAWHPGGANAISPVIKLIVGGRVADVVVIGHQFSQTIFQREKISYRTIEYYGLTDVSLDSMGRLIEVESPDLILTGTSAQDEENKDVIEQTIVLAAKNRGILSLAVLDFWVNYRARFSDPHTGEEFKFLPDQIAIMDKIAWKEMIEEGFEEGRLVITGNPYFDNLAAESQQFTESKRREIRRQIGIVDLSLLFFFAGNVFKKESEVYGYWDLDNIRLIAEVLNDLNGLPDKVGVVIKLHPRVPESDILEINQFVDENSRGRMKLVANINPHNLILATDLTLTAVSTLGVEAVLMGKPCISLQPGLKGEDPLIIGKQGIIPVGYTPDDCKRLIKQGTVEKYRAEIVKRAANFRVDGKATERVINLVYAMLRVG